MDLELSFGVVDAETGPLFQALVVQRWLNSRLTSSPKLHLSSVIFHKMIVQNSGMKGSRQYKYFQGILCLLKNLLFFFWIFS